MVEEEEEDVSVVTAITLAINAMNEDESKVSASAIPWYVEAALGLLDFMPAALILIFCFVTSVSASIFRAWSCQAPSRTHAAGCVVQPCSLSPRNVLLVGLHHLSARRVAQRGRVHAAGRER